MKNPALFLAVMLALIIACNKSNNYSITDYTAGMTTMRQWAGTISGYAKGDTLFAGDTTHYEWPKIFNRTLTDTSITVGKVNGYAVSMMGFTLNYRSTDETAKSTRFDTVVTGSLNAVLIYYYDKDSLTFVSSQVSGFNALASQYYQNNITLHTK
jgi:hypothetical protein